MLVSACSSEQLAPQPNPEDFAAVAERITAPEEEAQVERELGSVHFTYNGIFIPFEYRLVVRAHAEFLKENPNLRVILEGNADIGGKHWVHNKIGFQRAEAVKNRLVRLGVEPVRISISTYGSDKPRVGYTGDNLEVTDSRIEEWIPNRRVDFIYVDNSR